MESQGSPSAAPPAQKDWLGCGTGARAVPPETLTPASVHRGHMSAQDRRTHLCSKPGRSPSHQLPSQGCPEAHIERKAILALPGLFSAAVPPPEPLWSYSRLEVQSREGLPQAGL